MKEDRNRQDKLHNKLSVSRTTPIPQKYNKRFEDLQLHIHGSEESTNRAMISPVAFPGRSTRKSVVFFPDDDKKLPMTFRNISELRQAIGESNNNIFGKGKSFKYHGEIIESKLKGMEGIFVGQTPDQIKKLKDKPAYVKFDASVELPYKGKITNVHVLPSPATEPEKKKNNEKKKATKSKQ